jgi:hypothetical protein
VLEIERKAQRRIEGPEEQLEHPLVARALQRHADRAEPVAECPHAGLEDVE